MQSMATRPTSQSVNGPLLEFLELDLCGRRGFIEVETMSIFVVLVGGVFELLLLVIDSAPSLRIDSVVLLSDHAGETRQRWMLLWRGFLDLVAAPRPHRAAGRTRPQGSRAGRQSWRVSSCLSVRGRGPRGSVSRVRDGVRHAEVVLENRQGDEFNDSSLASERPSMFYFHMCLASG